MRTWITILVMVLLGTTAYVLLRDSGEQRDAGRAEALRSSSETEAAASQLDVEEPAMDEQGAQLAPEARQPGSAARAEAEIDPIGAGVRGRVDLAGACGSDPELEVFLLAKSLGESELLPLLANQGMACDLLARAPVRPDGSFLLALPEGHPARAFASVRGPHAVTPESVEVDLTGERPLVLHPEARACLDVVLATADGRSASGARILCESGNLPMQPQQGADRYFRFELRSDEQGHCLFQALPPDQSWRLSVFPDDYAAQRVQSESIPACQTAELRVSLLSGASLAGSVRDEDGRPIASAEIKASWAGQWMGFDDVEVRKAHSADDGSFLLPALPVGQLSVQASSNEYVASKKSKLELTQGEQRTGFALVLSLGNSIAGRVSWPDGRPAEGEWVAVSADVAAMEGMDFLSLQRGASSKTKTDASGAFRATGLGKGPFRVECVSGSSEPDAEGLRASFGALKEPGESGDGQPVLRALARKVQPGTTDLLLVLQPPPGLWGMVVDPRGSPIASFDVMVQEVAGGGLLGRMSPKRTRHFTDEGGRFFFENLDAGSWEISASAEGHASAEPLPLELPGTSAEDPIVVHLVPTATIEGIVRSPEGAPLAGARVLETRGEQGLQTMMENLRRRETAVKSDADGRFRIEGVLPGSLALHAESDDWAPSAKVPLEAVGGQVLHDIELRVLMGGLLTGEVIDKEGKPGVGRMINAQMMPSYEQRMTRTDEAGLFRIEHMPPGKWQVSAISPGGDWIGEEGLDAAKLLKDLEFAYVSIEDGVESHIVLGGKPAGAVHVVGRVSLRGEPVAGAMLSFNAGKEGPLTGLELVTADTNGNYEVDLDEPGHYTVTVAKLSGVMGQQSSVEFPSEIPETSEYRLDLALPLGRISGRVYGPDGPLAGARVSLAVDGVARSDTFFGGQYAELQTDKEGNYLLDALRAGTYRITVGGSTLLGLGGAATTGRLTRGGLDLGEEQWLRDIDFRLEAPGTLRILVHDEQAKPVSGASIFVRDGSGRIVDTLSFQQSDSSGMCRYQGLHPGAYTVLARSGNAASQESKAVQVAAGGESEVRLELSLGAIIWVRFRDAEGGALPAHVQVTDSAGRDVTAMIGLADIQALYEKGGFSPGEYRIGPLAPGKYRVHAWSDDGRSATKSVTVEAGEREQRFVLRLQKE